MGIDHLTPHLDELFSTTEEHYVKIRKGNEEENIHQLRVNLKKINAVFRLVAYISPQSFNAKLAFGPLKQIFDLAGEVRDLQIADQVFFHYQSAYHESIQIALKKAQDLAIGQLVNWKKSNPENHMFVLGETSAKCMKSISQVRLLEGSLRYIKYLYKRIETLKNSKRKDKWHRVRITLKRIRFIMDLCLKIETDFVPIREYELVRFLEKLLGDWHDRVIVVENIRLLTPVSISAKNKTDDQGFFKSIGNDQRSLLAASRFYLRDLFVQIREQYY